MVVRAAIVLLLVAGRALGQPGDWAPHRDPFDPAVVVRYKQILARDPHDAKALAKLQALYKSFRSLDVLEREYLEATEDHGTLVVRGRLRIARNDPALALELFERAATLDPDDPKVWMAIGGLRRNANDDKGARVAFEHALADAPPAPLAREALHVLIELAWAMKEPAVVDGYYVRLLALEPTNVDLWLERGDALSRAGKHVEALDTFEAVEGMLGNDPQRRLDVIARRGDTLEHLNDDRGAVAEYRRAIAAAPKGYHLIPELTNRLVLVYRRQHAIPGLIARLEQDWPVKARGFFEWTTLGSLYAEIGSKPLAIVAYQHATKLAPEETDAQRHLIALFDRTGNPTAATEQYAAAMRGAPGDASLALELAERLWPKDQAAAITVLTKLDPLAARDPSLQGAIADVYTKWGRHDLARRVIEKLARLEPDDEDHWLALARSYLASDDVPGALAAWKRVAHQQPGALIRLGELLLDDEHYDEALVVLGESIELDGMNPEPWRQKSWAYDDLGDFPAAIEAAEHELLLASPDRVARHTARHHIIQLLVKTRGSSDDYIEPNTELWTHYVDKWRHAFMDKAAPDLDAGYLLVDAYESGSCGPPDYSCSELIAVVEKLAVLAPEDPEVTWAQVRAYRSASRNRDAVIQLRKLVRQDPAHAKEVQRQIDEIGVYVDSEDLRDPFPDGDDSDDEPYFGDREDPAALSAGVHMGIGADLHGELGSSLAIGLAARYRLTRAFALDVRVDWSKRGGTAMAPSSIGGSLGLMRRIIEGRDAALGFTTSTRAEVRLGDHMDQAWDRVGLAGEASLDLLLHDSPIGIGARLDQWLVGGIHDTTLMFDFSVEWR